MQKIKLLRGCLICWGIGWVGLYKKGKTFYWMKLINLAKYGGRVYLEVTLIWSGIVKYQDIFVLSQANIIKKWGNSFIFGRHPSTNFIGCFISSLLEKNPEIIMDIFIFSLNTRCTSIILWWNIKKMNIWMIFFKNYAVLILRKRCGLWIWNHL